MATIGQPLTVPEAGWKRCDDTDNRILYSSSFELLSNSNAYQGTYHNGGNAPGEFIHFKFYGTKLRIIGALNNIGSNNVRVLIDDIEYNPINYYSTSLNWQVLVYEKTGLELGTHTIKLINTTSAKFWLDAIDIDDTGCILNPLLNRVSSLNNMQVGNIISCRYTALTSGQVGTFSELGTCTAPEIPVTSSATPDGLFYWVFVGYDTQGRMKFVADRNIQHSISWDNLNSAGIASGEGLSVDLSLGSSFITTVRLLTGGISSTDKENEWNKIIAESTLGGTITAGDNNIWNWSGCSSWTSSIGSTNTARVNRGYSGLIAYASTNASSDIKNLIGFRPVLLVESLETIKYLIQEGLNIYNINPSNYGGNLPTELLNLQIGKTLALENDLYSLTPEDIDSLGANDLPTLKEAINLLRNKLIKIIMCKGA